MLVRVNSFCQSCLAKLLKPFRSPLRLLKISSLLRFCCAQICCAQIAMLDTSRRALLLNAALVNQLTRPLQTAD